MAPVGKTMSVLQGPTIVLIFESPDKVVYLTAAAEAKAAIPEREFCAAMEERY